MYLETTAELNVAIPLYEKLGYRYTEQSMGESGHFGCEIRMLKAL
jgi:putative acetyltransferase